MQILKKKTEYDLPGYRQFKNLRLASLIIMAVMGAILVFCGYFVYNNIYGAIGEMQSIILLKSQGNSGVIDFDRLEKVQAAWDKKHDNSKAETLRNLFITTAVNTSNSNLKKTTKK